MSVLVVLLVTALAAVLVQLLTWLVALRLGRVSVVDVTWGPTFAVIALVAFLATPDDGDPARRVALVVLTTVWGLRLGTHIGLRQRGVPRGQDGEDPRYTEMLGRSKLPPKLAALVMVFLLQAASAWFISLPVQVGLISDGSLIGPAGFGVLAWLGVAVWSVGFFFETVGDWQLQRFRDDPSSKGQVLNTGLWRYTRHPNYFGDAAVWWGLFLIAGDAGWPLLVFPATAFMTWLLAAKTGKPLMEKALSSSRPGYAEYVERTSGFIPLPPKRR
ncbi:DUF1295 domain-containing protein [Spongisporangium articulatum]|uniref:DUF1295 domain-containing protein n=1 Tax=Spongisporangium articulatum TaxID=3362603 RepID=A0ABW8AQH4_9ACTN